MLESPYSIKIGGIMITFNYLLNELKRHRKKVLLANLLAIFSTLIYVSVPLFIPHLVDEVLLDKQGALLPFLSHLFVFDAKEYYILIVFVLMLFLRGVHVWLIIMQKALSNQVVEDIRFDLRKYLLDHLTKVSMSEYDRLGSGSISSKMMTDIASVIKFLSGSIGNIAVQVFTLIGIGLVLLYLNWQLALIILILNPLVIKLFIKAFKKVSKVMKTRNRAIGNFTNSLTESLELFNQIRVQNREEHFANKVNQDAWEIRQSSYQLELDSSKSINGSRLFVTYANDLFKMVALYWVFLGEMSIGEMLAIFLYATMIIPPIHMIMKFVQDYHDAKEAMDRLNDILRLKKEPYYPMKIDPFSHQEGVSIELRGVSFGYDEHHEVFKDFNLSIASGEKIAITGETGSGKSTLANLIMGLYAPSQGEIYYNGVEIKQIGYQHIREHIGVVLQAPLMFNASLRYNLSLGKSYRDDEIYEVLKIAQLYDFVMGLSQGLDTIVGKNGTKLSGGQRQRLSIARVLLDHPKVLIFDESTSSLDVDTEDRLLEGLESYIRHKTVITIAHRQSTIDRADRVITLSAK